MASTEEYSRSVLRVSVAQICQNLGWNATQTSPLELMTDVLERYLEEIAKISHRYSEQFGRTQPNLDDLGLTFRHMGINLGELEDYVRHVDPVPFAHEVVSFPAPKTTNLQFPNANSREILHHREEHIHEHLPHMFPGMEDEVVQEPAPTPALTSQGQTQENTSAETEVKSPVAGEKRPLPNSADGPASKRPRVTPSNLPEEAAHSQYEMTSVTISPGGFLTPSRGKGRLPDSRTPPPTIRHALTFTDPTPASGRGVDGSEANKENTAVDPAPKEPPVRISLSTGKDGATIVSKPESSKGKKKDKLGLKDKVKKPKKSGLKKPASDGKKTETKIKVTVGASKKTSVTLEEPKDVPPKKKQKVGKPKEGKAKAGKSPRSEKRKEKGTAKKKPSVSATPTSSVANEGSSESRLKDLLLSQDKYRLDDDAEPGPSTSRSPRRELDFDSVHSPDTDLTLRLAFPPTDIFDSSSHETSPQRLVIAEAEGRAQEREEEKRIRLKNIDDTISAVVRESASVPVKEEPKISSESPVAVPVPAESPSPKKRGRPKKVKPKVKSNEFIDEEVIKQEAEDEMGARSVQSINDTINAVISQGSEGSPAPEKSKAAEPSSAPSNPTKNKEGKKEGKKKKKLDKTKSPGVKKKLKDKLQNKGEKAEASPPIPPAADVKPFVSDKFSNAEMKVFEFGEPDSPPAILARRPSQAERESTHPPVPSTPPTSQGSFSPVDIKPIIKSPTPETAVIVSSTSTSSTPSQDHPPTLTLKIGIPKDQDKHREKSRDKEHRKEKKEKRRDKEKKKKNKDKDRDRDREHKHHHHHKHEKSKKKEETTTAEGSGFKIKIKLGSKPAETSSVTVTEEKPPAEPDIKQEISSPRPEIPKLVIRRGDTSEGNSLQKKKHSSKLQKSASFVKLEPRNTPPTLEPASPLPSTPPPPVLSRNNSPVRGRSPSPTRVKTEKERGRSPKRKSSPPRQVFSFASPRSSPPRGRPSVTPPPRTPSPSHPKSPSPMPKTPSPRRHHLANSPMSISSPSHRSPSAGRKSPTPTPKTPSLSPAYPPSSPVHSHHSPSRGRSPGPSKPLFRDRSPSNKKPVVGSRSPSPLKPLSPGALKPLFGTPERETSPPPSPLFSETPVDVKSEVKEDSLPPAIVRKPKGKIGRPRSKSPRGTSPKGKKPKVPKSPKGFGKATKSSKAGTGKSPGRGRPPKAKTLALRAALAAATSADEDTVPTKTKSKPPPPAPLKIKTKEMPELSPPALEAEKSALNSSSESPSPTNLSIAFDADADAGPSSARQRGAVEAETVGSFFDTNTGQQIWICPSCKLQDDGSPMIGCDKCDDWYHWVCVGINSEPPEEELWFCPRCKSKLKQDKPKAKRGRKKKNL
ncbi:transcription initiation factor TFIID subunit 3-like [Littorina saxatilis]|uniref:PHD-type domain-containing protein n=1 Tax=Littorina saxatilis TaxID=31220 RepID=A0AAN9BFU5_9CAEN